MAVQPPQLVEENPPRFRVREVGQADAGAIEAELEQAEEDGYEYREMHALANGNVLLFFSRSASVAKQAEA